jgi:hypothetical protein
MLAILLNPRRVFFTVQVKQYITCCFFSLLYPAFHTLGPVSRIHGMNTVLRIGICINFLTVEPTRWDRDFGTFQQALLTVHRPHGQCIVRPGRFMVCMWDQCSPKKNL